jgi:hypothetical protein
MKKIFYEKVGRRYKPVYEYDQTLMDAFPKGTHIVICYPGGQSTRYNVNPNYASMIAAGRLAEDAISKKLMEASEIRMQRKDRDKQLTPSQRAAWDNLVKEFGTSASQLEWASVREIAEAGVDAMQAEADKLMQNEGVRKAYEHFQLMCELSKTRETAD